jgi:hypothetical protein
VKMNFGVEPNGPRAGLIHTSPFGRHNSGVRVFSYRNLDTDPVVNILLNSRQFIQLVEKFREFMELEGSLPCSQSLIFCPYPDPVVHSFTSHLLTKICFNIEDVFWDVVPCSLNLESHIF